MMSEVGQQDEQGEHDDAFAAVGFGEVAPVLTFRRSRADGPQPGVEPGDEPGHVSFWSLPDGEQAREVVRFSREEWGDPELVRRIVEAGRAVLALEALEEAGWRWSMERLVADEDEPAWYALSAVLVRQTGHPSAWRYGEGGTLAEAMTALGKAIGEP